MEKNIEYYLTELETGDKVVTIPLKQNKKKKVTVSYDIGSICENKDNHGIAHFIEHMVFNDSRNYKGKERQIIFDKYGGGSNGYTSFKEVCFSIITLEEYFKNCLDAFFDMFVNPLFKEKDIRKEKNIIAQEIRQRYDNDGIRLFFEIISQLYPNSPISYGDIAGTINSIMKFDQDMLFDFYNTFYVSPNRWICFSGNITHEESLEYVKNRYKIGKKVDLPDIRKYYNSSNIMFVEKRTDSVSSTCRLCLNFDVEFSSFEEKFLFNELIHRYFSHGLSSPLYRKLREENNLVYGCWSYILGLVDDNRCDQWVIGWNTAPENIEKCYNLIIEEIEKIKNKELYEDNIETARNAARLSYSDMLMNHKDVEKIILPMLKKGYEPVSIEYLYDLISNVTKEDFEKLIDKLINSLKNNMFACVTNAENHFSSIEKDFDTVIYKQFKCFE